MSEWGLTTVEITDELSFYEACDILHDARFDLARTVYLPEEKRWTAIFSREYFEGKGAVEEDRKFLIFRHYTFPLVESVLTLHSVCDLKVKDRAGINEFTFNEVAKIKDHYDLLFCENLRIRLRFDDEPRGELKDTRFLERQGGFWTLGKYFRPESEALLQRTP
ncbi:hypothetical protein AMJ85_09480 [candidate division BRC1 bacterium SM23_51]|nr:MAG: hypothetical protein AMJ85_09480 [candidate division BRC1 bacterium SM23_51]